MIYLPQIPMLMIILISFNQDDPIVLRKQHITFATFTPTML